MFVMSNEAFSTFFPSKHAKVTNASFFCGPLPASTMPKSSNQIIQNPLIKPTKIVTLDSWSGKDYKFMKINK